MTMRPQGPSEEIVPSQGKIEIGYGPDGLTGLENRHPSTRHFGPLFAFGHLPGHLQAISIPLAAAAARSCSTCGDGPELSAGLRKLLEAKDCLVRQSVLDGSAASGVGTVKS